MTNYNDFWIVSAGAGAWYELGNRRLKSRLIELGYEKKCNLLFFDYLPEGCPNHTTHPYYIKIFAIREAINRGAKKILWIDCSIFPYKSFDAVFDLINENGFFAWKTGYNCAQTCNDVSLDIFNLNRDDASNMHEIATTIIGFDLEKNKFWEFWESSALKGAFFGSRNYNMIESSDPRFLFHRQDQSAGSLVCAKLNLIEFAKKIQDFAQYNYDNTIKQPENYYFLIAGGYDNQLPEI